MLRINKKATEIKRPLKRLREVSNPARVSALQMFESLCYNYIDQKENVLDEIQTQHFIEIIIDELKQSKKDYII